MTVQAKRNAELTITLGSIEDAASIAELMQRAQGLLSCKDFFVISSLKRVRWKLENNSFAYVAKSQDKIVGYYIFEMPGLDPAENPGYDIGLNEDELSRVLCMGSVAVDPDYRGLGLQRRMSKMGEEEGLRRGFDIFMATADPRNTPSLKNFLLEGFDIVCVKEDYYQNGVPRAILLKRADGKKIRFQSTTNGVVLDSTSE